MKKYIYIIFGFLLLSFPFGKVMGQNCDYTLEVSTAPSTCQSNGTVTVTIKGEMSTLKNIDYSLESAGFNQLAQSSNIFNGVPSGTYTVTVRAFCVDGGAEVVKIEKNVTVGGNYQVPVLRLSTSDSRKSYAECNSGKIALEVVGGSGTFTFTILSAPTGLPTGLVTATRKGTTNIYDLTGENYPAGSYQVEVDDGCYTGSLTFTLGTVTGLPDIPGTTNEAWYFGYPTDGNCSILPYSPYAPSSSLTDYYRYYSDGLYELAVAPEGVTPSAGDWFTWKSSESTNINISPYTLADFYESPVGTKNLSIYMRLKGCATVNKFENIRFSSRMSSNRDQECDGAKFTLDLAYNYSNTTKTLVCFPLSVTVTKRIGSTIVYTQTGINDITAARNVVFTLPYDASTYDIEVRDGSNKVISNSFSISTPTEISVSNRTLIESLYCDYYTFGSYPNYIACYPIEVTAIHPTTGATQTGTIDGPNKAISPRLILDYNTTYNLEYKFTNANPVQIVKATERKTSPISTSYTFGISPTTYSNTTSYYCTENGGFLTLKPDKYYPVGTTITITGPPGYTTQTVTTTSSSSSAREMPFTVLPPGHYTATIDQGCGTPIVVEADFNGMYAVKNDIFTYTKTEDDCAGLKITPVGTLTYQGMDADTYYRITKGPDGVNYDKTVKIPGESFYITASGTYTLGIMTRNLQTGCTLRTIDIECDVQQFQLDPKETSAYVCVGGYQGIILAKAIGGFGSNTYSYELWDANNTAKINEATPTILPDGRVRFDYGAGGDTYTVRFEDDCGNKFSQIVTLADLKTARIVSGTTEVCSGDPIQLNCLTLGNTKYEWTGPNGFTSDEQNPNIPIADASMSGVYKVSVEPEFCGVPVEQEITVNVYGDLIPAVASNVNVCSRSSGVSLESITTGGKISSYTYQWQTSTDGISGWTDIAGATQATYTPPTTQQGTFYFRKVTTDVCSTVPSGVITINVAPCYIPVNPDIQIKTER